MKTRYEILDGLRGVAAVSVLVYHLFEAIAFAAGAPEQRFYHGFLAVDFFFVLSGFVMGYAYDERLETGSLTTGGFIRRRLIRLHPMVVMGVAVGLVCYVLQGCTLWDGTSVPWSQILTAVVFGLFLIPSPKALDVRGNYEAFPLNGPHWSLFFEYIGRPSAASSAAQGLEMVGRHHGCAPVRQCFDERIQQYCLWMVHRTL